MSDKKSQDQSTRVQTPEAILSYPHLTKPQEGQNGGKAKYSCTLVFPQGTDMKALIAARNAAIDKKWPGKREALLKSETFKKGFRTDGDDKGYGEGSIFINCRSEQKPGVVFRYAGADGKPQAMTDEQIAKEMYPGAKVRASVTFFGFENNGNKGVGVAINNLQKLGEGDRLDNRVSAENEFTADLNAAPADLESLIG